MTLADLKNYYDNALDYMKRLKDAAEIEFFRGYFIGTFRLIMNILTEHEITDLPGLESLAESDNFPTLNGLELVKKIKIFDKYYGIYLDDYGQCYDICIDDQIKSFGTYNTNIVLNAVVEVFYNIYHKDLEDYLRGEK